MSTPPEDHACTIVVEPWLAKVLRRQTLLVLKYNHHHFKRLLKLSPDEQYARAMIFRDAFDVLDAIGWDPKEDAGPVEVPLTAGHVEQLYRRRYDLGAANLDRLDAFNAAGSDAEATALRSGIETDRLASQALDRLFTEYSRALLAS
jgi:hypothetical protein